MNVRPLEFRTARSTAEATALWAEVPDAYYLAGGTDLLIQMRLGRRSPARLIDLKRIPGLSAIEVRGDGALSIGACVPLGVIAAHPEVRARYPLLAECCLAVGSYPVRNRATMAGNVCNASPAADTAAALLALEAAVEASGPNGDVVLPLAGFFQGPGKTVLPAGALVTALVLPAKAAGCRGSFHRLSRRRGVDLATLGVLVGRHAAGGAGAHRVVLTAVAPTPLRVPAAEALLDRQGAAAAAQAAEAARAACKPIDDVRGTAQYRREMVGVLVARAAAALG
ncbi:MAG: FAD binding domain-containing protein [Deltaproteobacteria bacterium]|nr:FAD binding domain-containing protein [Deltaproteobacteria bacterium]